MSLSESFTVVNRRGRKKHALQQAKLDKSKDQLNLRCQANKFNLGSQEFVETLFWSHIKDCLLRLNVQPITTGGDCDSKRNVECGDLCETVSKHALMTDLGSIINGSARIRRLVCYGLGSFTSSYIAKHQLSLLTALKHHFNLLPECCIIYDPIFTTEEKTLLRDYGFTYQELNEEGKRSIAEDSFSTLFFMPHCPKELYNNLLWANWSLERLSRIIVIGNSFQSMALSVPSRILNSEYHYISTILPYCHVTELHNTYEPDDVFNDLAVHRFTAQNIPQDLLRPLPAPIYSASSELVTSR